MASWPLCCLITRIESWTLDAVVSVSLCPSSLPITGRVSPSASVRDVKEWQSRGGRAERTSNAESRIASAVARVGHGEFGG